MTVLLGHLLPSWNENMFLEFNLAGVKIEPREPKYFVLTKYMNEKPNWWLQNIIYWILLYALQELFVNLILRRITFGNTKKVMVTNHYREWKIFRRTFGGGTCSIFMGYQNIFKIYIFNYRSVRLLNSIIIESILKFLVIFCF